MHGPLNVKFKLSPIECVVHGLPILPSLILPPQHSEVWGTGDWGLDLVTQIFFGLGPSTGLVQMTPIKSNTKHHGCFRSILCEKRNSI